VRKLRELGLTKKDLIEHFCKVNNCSEEDFKNVKKMTFEHGKRGVGTNGYKISESLNL